MINTSVEAVEQFRQEAAEIAGRYQDLWRQAILAHSEVDYYDDELIDLRNQWAAEVLGLKTHVEQQLCDAFVDELDELLAADDSGDLDAAYADAHRRQDRRLSELSVVAFQHMPTMANCEACGRYVHTHDDAGELVAEWALWDLATRRTISYMLCEDCKEQPEVTSQILARVFADWEEHDRRRQRELDEMIEALDRQRGAAVGQNNATGPQNGPQPGANNNTSTATPNGGNNGPQAQQTKPPVFEFLTIDQLMSRPSKRWHVKDLIGEREMVIPFGPSGHGKTFAIIDLIYAMCLGQRWAGRFDIARPLTVAYCAGEGLDGIRDRFAAAEAKWGVRLPADRFVMVPSLPQLYQRTGRHIKEFVEQWRQSGRGALDVLVMDTFHKAAVGADENSSKDIGIVYESVKYAVDQLGCSIVMPHHANKGGKDSRGSSAIDADFDNLFRIEKSGGEHVMTAVIIKDASEWQPLRFRLIAHGNSAYVDWLGGAAPNGPQPGGNTAATLRTEVLDLFRSDPTAVYDIGLVMSGIGAGNDRRQEVQQALTALVKDKHVERWRKDPTVTSGRNAKWLYRLSALGAALSGAVP